MTEVVFRIWGLEKLLERMIASATSLIASATQP